MEVWPALDLLDGHLVRLRQGAYSDVTRYSHDPLEFVRTVLGGLPPRVHVVDLGGARTGAFGEWAILRQLVREGIQVEAGGGFRSLDVVEKALTLGVKRVVLGTRLLTDGTFAEQALERFGALALVAGLDIRQGRARIQGWVQDGEDATSAWSSLYRLGYRLVNVTDIRGDGTLTGLDPAFWAKWAQLPGDVGAGGGIAGPEDLVRLASWGISRAIVGKAWMEGRISAKEVGIC